MSESNIISDINIGGGNDMIGKFEEYINDIIFSSDLKKLIKVEINNLRKEIKNKNINFTQNEQEELKKLFKIVINNEKISNNEKIKLLVNIMNVKIQDELKELDEKNKQKPEKLISLVEESKEILRYGEISDKYLGNSDYLIFIFPVKHRNKLNKDILDIDEKSLSILVNQNNNLIGIIGELIKKGICRVYSFEGFEMMEVSESLPGCIELNDIIALNNYEDLLKDPVINNKKIKKVEKIMSYLGSYLIEPELKFGDKILSYGIEEKKINFINNDIFSFYELVLGKIDNISENFIENVNNFLTIKKKEYIKEGYEEKFINNYIELLKSVLVPENINNLSFEDYLGYIIKVYYYYKFTRRNESVVKNLEQLHKNTRTNGIMLQFGADHFKKDIKVGVPEFDDVIIPSLKIKDIKTLLKEKGISFVEITPYTEKR